MTDQNSQFYAILTAVGEAKQANANALGVPWTFAQMGVGDANGTDPLPVREQTKLINERRRAPLNQVKVDPKNANIIIAEQVIPPDVGGWWIREIGLYDAAGDLVAVANCAPSFKPLLSQGTGKTQIVRLNIIVTSSANVQLKIDPSVVLATREYVDSLWLNILPPNKVAGSYTKVQINERGIVVAGYNPDSLAGLGIGFETQELAETGTGKEKPMNAYLTWLTARKVVQALWKEGTEDSWGVMKIATQPEVDGGTGGNKSVTPGTLNTTLGKRFKQATEAVLGLIGIASQNEVDEGLDNKKAVTSATLFARMAAALKPALETRFGLIQLASQEEVDAGKEFSKAVTSLTFTTRMKSYVEGLWVQSTIEKYGVVKLASQNEVDEGTNPFKVVSVATLAMRLAAVLKPAQETIFGLMRQATQAEVNEGLEISKAVTSKTLAGRLALLWKPATESVEGVARISTLPESFAGTGDSTIITPRKMQYGISYTFAARGHFAFPTWAGGLIINWGFETGIQQATAVAAAVGPVRDATLSLAFPKQGFGVLATMGFATMATTAGFAPGATLLSKSVVRVQNNYTASNGDIFWLAIGN